MKSFEIVDFILSPTTPTTAFPLSNDKKDPTEMYLQDIYTTSVNLAGLPALSVPAGISEEKPVGLQIIGNYFEESRILGVANRFQQATDWHKLQPAFVAEKNV